VQQSTCLFLLKHVSLNYLNIGNAYIPRGEMKKKSSMHRIQNEEAQIFSHI
jgi:hypothetical protein